MFEKDESNWKTIIDDPLGSDQLLANYLPHEGLYADLIEKRTLIA